MAASATKLKVDLSKVLDQLKSISTVAKTNNWVFRVNDLDQAIFSPERVPSGSYLWSVDDEKYLYLDRNSNVNGFFIEYFRANFLEHETKYKPILGAMKTRGDTKVLEATSRTGARVLNALEKDLLSDFSQYKQIIEKESRRS